MECAVETTTKSKVKKVTTIKTNYPKYFFYNLDYWDKHLKWTKQNL